MARDYNGRIYSDSSGQPSYDRYVEDQIEDTTKDMWYWIGTQLTGREKSRGQFIPKDHIADLKEKFIDKASSRGKPRPDSSYAAPYGSIKDIRQSGRTIEVGDIFECIYSVNSQFKNNKEYKVRSSSSGTLYLNTDSGKPLPLSDKWADRYTKTFFAFKQDNVNRPYINANEPFTRAHELIKNKEEDAMCLSEKSINRLNGLKVGEEKLVELTQESSEKKVKTYDLVKLLQKTEAFGKLKAGTECLVQSVNIEGDKLKVTILDGEVDREKTESILAALQSKLLSEDKENSSF